MSVTMGRNALAVAVVAATAWPNAVQGQATARTNEPQIEIVHTVGCVEQRDGNPAGWWLTRAAEPTVTDVGPFNEDEVEEARSVALGEAGV